MCLCRNSCLPRGLGNWTLIYNLPLEAKLEGDSCCLQLPVVWEAKLCFSGAAHSRGAWLEEQPASLEDCLFWHMLPQTENLILHGKGDDHVPLSVLMGCFYVTGCQTAQHAEIATMGSAWQHLNQIFGHSGTQLSLMRNCMFELLYVPLWVFKRDQPCQFCALSDMSH